MNDQTILYIILAVIAALVVNFFIKDRKAKKEAAELEKKLEDPVFYREYIWSSLSSWERDVYAQANNLPPEEVERLNEKFPAYF